MTDIILQRTKNIPAEAYHEKSDLVNHPITTGGDNNTSLSEEEIIELGKLTHRASQIIRVCYLH